MEDFNVLTHLMRQREFSVVTFGTGYRVDGLVDHIREEIDEVYAKPNDLEEWIDILILAIDGAWRSGMPLDWIAAYLAEGHMAYGADPSMTYHGILRNIHGLLDQLLADSNKNVLWLTIAVAAMKGAFLSGYYQPAIWAALDAKQTKNELRKWPPLSEQVAGQKVKAIKQAAE